MVADLTEFNLWIKKSGWSGFYDLKRHFPDMESIAQYMLDRQETIISRKRKSFFETNPESDAFHFACQALNTRDTPELRKKFENITGYERIETADELFDASKMIGPGTTFEKFIPVMMSALNFKKKKK